MLPANWKIQIIRSKRKTIAVSAKGDGYIQVKAPYAADQKMIYDFLEEIRPKLEKNMREMDDIKEKTEKEGYLSRSDLEELAQKAVAVLPGRVDYFAGKLGVTYGRITIRNQKSRWGSCSSKGNLNFNCLLMLAPPQVADYVVVHELCHRLEMNHSPRFWHLVGQVMPDYRKWDAWLSREGKVLLRRMTG